MKTSVLVPVGAIAFLTAAVVLASPMTTDTGGKPAIAPNRADVFLASTCGAVTPSVASDQQSWHDALGSKRALDRATLLANAGLDPAKGCAPAKG